VTVTVEADGAPSHVLRRVTGLRSLSWKQWTLSVNGERLFLKGTNQGPSRMDLADATGAELRRDVELARDAGLDLLRLHAHVSRPELYEAADELGVLLWQDFPLQWGYARGIRRQAARQAEAAVDLLGHHPSVALWCAHNAPIAFDVEPGAAPSGRAVARFAAGQALPTWNKTVLDRSVKRAIEKADGTRPVIAHSGVLPHPGSGGTDSHLYFGWYHGDERDLAGFARGFPRMVRFVSQFGAQAVPDDEAFMGAAAWPDLDWERLARTHSLQPEVMARHVPPSAFASYEAWKAATQAYQATLLKHHVETLRRLKYRPTGGFCQFSFADAHPSVTWSVLDHRRNPKAGYHALAAACRPVIVVADRLPAGTAPGDALALDVHVVSDLRHPLPDATVTAVLGWTGGSHRWGWRGDVPADACARIGTIQAVVPDEPGPLTLDLRFSAGDVSAENHDETVVTALD
jgi:beta-mannosidase